MREGLRLVAGRLGHWWAPAALILLGLLAWRNTLENGFVYDDEVNIVQNEALRTLTPLSKFFDPKSSSTDAKMNAGLWRPLTRFVWALDYRLDGLDPKPYHATNLLLHLLNALLVFYLAGMLSANKMGAKGADSAGASQFQVLELGPGPSPWAAFLTALVFLLHPVQVESVAWVNGLSNLLFAFFSLSAFILFVLHRKTRRTAGGVLYACSLAAYAFGLLSKETAVVLPVLLLAYSFLFERGADNRSGRVPWVAVAPYFALTVGFLILRYAVLGNATMTGNWAGGTVPLLLTMLKAFATYVRLAVLPHPLSLEYLFPVKRAVDLEVLRGAALLGGLLFAAFRSRERSPRLSLAALFFLVPLLPVANILPIETVLNERFLYLSLVGWGLAAGEALAWMLERGAPARRPAAATNTCRQVLLPAAVCACLCAAYAAKTIARNETWKDTYSLASENLKTCPQSSRLRYAMGKGLAERGRWAEAIGEYRLTLAIELYGDKTAEALAAFDPFEPAELARAGEYRKSLQVRVDSGQTLYNIGSAYIRLGESGKAAGYLELAKSLRQDSAEVLNNLAVAYAQSGRYEEAVSELEGLLARDPANRKAAHNIALFREVAREGFPASVVRSFPALREKWERLAQFRYDETGVGIRPAAGSGRSMLALKPEERMALEAMAARESVSARTGREPVSTPVLPKTFGRPYSVSFGDSSVEIRPLAAKPSAARIRDGLVLYPDAYAETSVFFTASESEVEEFYLLRSPRAPREFVQELRPRGRVKSFEVTPEGKLAALDGSGARVLELSRPVVIDAKGRRVEGSFRLDMIKGRGLGPQLSTGIVGEEWGETVNKFNKSTSDTAILALRFDDAGLEYPVLIDPTWTTSGAPSMSAMRVAHSATLLPNGKVLVAGGSNGGYLSSAELYDPSSGSWTTTGSLASTRGYHTATLLPNGKVLVAGGSNGSALSTAELYDPASGAWSTTGPMSAARQQHTATLLPNGKVLAAGGNSPGFQSTAELYNPASGTWTTTGPMASARDTHTATLLLNGKVLRQGDSTAVILPPPNSMTPVPAHGRPLGPWLRREGSTRRLCCLTGRSWRPEDSTAATLPPPNSTTRLPEVGLPRAL